MDPRTARSASFGSSENRKTQQKGRKSTSQHPPFGEGAPFPAHEYTPRPSAPAAYGRQGSAGALLSNPPANYPPPDYGSFAQGGRTPGAYPDTQQLTKSDADEGAPGGNDDIEELGPLMDGLERIGLFRSDSMEMSNDPRFFQQSILNKRMAAFSSLGVISGLMIGFSQGSVKNVRDMDVTTLEGNLALAGFIFTSLGLFANVVSTYVSVAQMYHTYRLETAGPTGFEMATSYYLNPNVVAWRHLAIKSMLLSLPLFLVSTGIEIEINIVETSDRPRPPSRTMARIIGISSLVGFNIMAWIIFYIHRIHAWVFQDRYEVAMQHQSPYVQRVQSMMRATADRRQSAGGRPGLDV
mmetsp:Transcript_34283/g.63951  ORF Transcript_34283/g.63951 Transcript_34283/m.63951 type:complete len:353 (-) Transcript_34283:42-1100(-)